MKPKIDHAELIFRIKLVILAFEILLPFILYYGLQSGQNSLAMLCLALIMLGLIGVVFIK